ncbi:kinase-like protein [Pholiota conissans]|uniref:Kinase-like protein n=1 Tax=Pholiota conissans TaxID=109636 RepID=A0A9P6CTB3_9AGAR|nr:kinase-like protein [Pholiota conissans]
MSPFPEECFDTSPSDGGGFYPALIHQKLDNEKYEIIRKLGYGRRSSTWLVVDASRGDLLAVKTFTVGASERAKNIELRISKAVARVDDAQRVLRGFWQESKAGTHLCFVMPALGTSVERLANEAEYHRLPIHTVQRIIYVITRVLKTLHASGIMHGAIKADNIYFPANFDASESKPTTVTVKKHTTVISQPLSSRIKWNSKPKIVADWSIYVGNFGHAQKGAYEVERKNDYSSAPETLLKDASCSPQTDIWMLGFLAYTLLIGNSPFASYGPSYRRIATMSASVGDDIPKTWFSDAKMKQYNPDANDGSNVVSIEAGLATVLRKKDAKEAAAFIKGCLRLDPQNRFTAKECKEHEWLAHAGDCSCC